MKQRQLRLELTDLAIICRVCHTRAKAGVLCQDCGLVCHAGCVTRETNKCDPLEQLALYTRQRELSTGATAGDSTTSLSYFPLENDTTLSASPGNIWKRSRAVLERRGSNLLASASRHDLSHSTSEKHALDRGGKDADSPSMAGLSSQGKENEGIARGGRGSDGANDNTVRQTACKASSTASSGDRQCTVMPTAIEHTKEKDSKSDCAIM